MTSEAAAARYQPSSELGSALALLVDNLAIDANGAEVRDALARAGDRLTESVDAQGETVDELATQVRALKPATKPGHK